jgi:hypothetical protein
MSTRTTAPGGIEEQLWPIACATTVLVGVLFVVIWVGGDFDDERLVYNGYTQLAAVAVLGAAIIFIGSKVRGRARRTAELAILLSLALHALGGLSAVYLFNSPLGGPGLPGTINVAAAENDEETPLPADYHWGQSDDDSAPQQAFEKPVETVVRDQATPAAQVKPRDIERPVPIAEAHRAEKAEITPLGAAAAPGKPLDVRRPEAAKVAELPPPDALAMLRQKGQDATIPDSPAPAPVAMPEAPKEAAKSIEPHAVQTEKADKYLWAKLATRSADPNNPDNSPPRKMTRSDVPSSDALPAPDIIARAPSQAPRQTSTTDSGAQAAEKISQEGRTTIRADHGVEMPSAVLPNAGFPAQFPAAEGGSPASNVEAQSNVPVERSNNSHAPLGPNSASAGIQEFTGGSSMLPTRRGAIDGVGRTLPSIGGNGNEDLNDLRSGSPGSNLRYGMAQSAAPARRSDASQTEDGGADLAAGQSGTLPRSQAAMGLPLPAAARISDNLFPSGAGGVGQRPGGMTSTLNVGQNISVQRVAGNGTPRGSSRDETYSALNVGDANLAGASAGNGPGTGIGPTGPRRVDSGASDGDDNGTGVPRARGEGFTPRATVEAGTSVGGPATVTQGPVQGAGRQGYSGPTVGPDESLGGVGRLNGPGQRIGASRGGPIEPSEIASAVGVDAPRTSGLGNRSRQSDANLDQILSGDEGTRGTRAGSGQVAVNSLVHEPLDPFRRGPSGGALGDSGDGQLTEPAIESGLEYFARTQFPDGHWSLHESPPGVKVDAGSLGELHADTAATGLALLTYMAAGYTHQDAKYRDTVRRGLDWLVKHQAADGNLSFRGSEPTHLYSQGIATMALCEAYGMTQDRDLHEAAQKAIDYIIAAQDPVRGGWRYRPRDGADTSVTGWQLMALRSAQMAGLNVPDQTLHNVSHWLDLAHAGRGTYVYNPWNLDTAEERKGRAPSPTMTAQATVMRMYLGEDRDHALLRQGADYLLDHLPEPAGAETTLRDCYYWYYGNMAMFLMQGDYWKAWDARVTPLVRAGQVERGPLKGSWSGSDPVPDIWSTKAGRHYVTAMHVLTLEFRYWHLPLFRELRRE